MNPISSQSSSRLQVLTVGAAIVVFAVGCDIPDRPPLSRPAEHSSAESYPGGRPADHSLEGQLGDTLETPRISFAGKWEVWDAHYRAGQHVGYSHIVAQAVADSPSGNIRYLVDDLLAVRRGSSTLIHRLSQNSIETTDGHFIGFESELHVGPDVTRFEGTMDKDVLVVESIHGSDRSSTNVPWQPTYRGLVAVEQSLRGRPMKEGESRVLEMLLPVQHVIATVRLNCTGNASVPMIDGKYQTLFEIDSYVQSGDSASRSVIWADLTGQIRRVYSPASHLVTFRTTQELATADLAGQHGDPAGENAAPAGENGLGDTATIDVTGELERPEQTRVVAYQVSTSGGSKSSDPPVAIGPAPGQSVKRMPDRSYRLLVSRDPEKKVKGFIASDLAVVDGDLAANAYIDFNQPMIRRIADAAVSARRGLSDREIALELTSTAGVMIAKRDVSKGFSRASEVALNSVGDCTERAVLLAALLRARKIPSRLACGLVYSAGNRPRMVYHMWTLAYVDDHWLPLDVADGGAAAPDRITLGTTNLSEGNEYDVVASVLDALGRMEIEIKGSQY